MLWYTVLCYINIMILLWFQASPAAQPPTKALNPRKRVASGARSSLAAALGFHGSSKRQRPSWAAVKELNLVGNPRFPLKGSLKGGISMKLP